MMSLPPKSPTICTKINVCSSDIDYAFKCVLPCVSRPLQGGDNNSQETQPPDSV